MRLDEAKRVKESAMENDRELLELAAKAAGIDLQFCADTGRPAVSDTHGGGSFWNPLTDDGDALRLAVKLRIELQWDERVIVAINYDKPINSYEHHAASEVHLADPYAATRRAIVRAAAEIAKANP
jgi:hypothetical protein